MPKKYWNRLRLLVSGLSDQELTFFIRLTRSMLPHPSKKSKILTLLASINNSNEGEVVKESDKQRKLSNLLEDKILDSLLLDVNLLRKDRNTHPNRILSNHKRILKSQILKDRGVLQRAFKIADNCVKNALLYEDYQLASQCRRLQLSMISFHQNEKAFHQLMTEADEYDYFDSLSKRAIKSFQELQLRKFHQLNENLDIYINGRCEILERSLEKLPSSTIIRFIVLYFKKERYEMEGNPNEALNIITQLQHLCNSNDCQIPLSLCELLFEQAKVSFELGQLFTARFFLQKCLNLLPIGSHSHHRALELLFMMEYLEGQYDRCHLLLSPYLRSSFFKDTLSEKHQLRFYFYECCLLIASRNFKKCNSRIDLLFGLQKPPDNINMQLRFMRIMCFISRKQFDQADKELEALRKFIARNATGWIVKDLGITGLYQFLKKLKRQGYQLEGIDAADEKIENLKTEFQSYLRTKPLTYHLVPYINWLSSIKNKGSQTEVCQQIDLHTYRRENLIARRGHMSRLYV